MYSLTLPRDSGQQTFAELMPELGYAVVWRGHVFDGREAKEQSLEIRLLTTAHLGVMLGNCCEQSVLVIKVPTDQRF